MISVGRSFWCSIAAENTFEKSEQKARHHHGLACSAADGAWRVHGEANVTVADFLDFADAFAENLGRLDRIDQLRPRTSVLAHSLSSSKPRSRVAADVHELQLRHVCHGGLLRHAGASPRLRRAVTRRLACEPERKVVTEGRPVRALPGIPFNSRLPRNVELAAVRQVGGPAAKREAAAHLPAALGLSKRRAYSIVNADLKMIRIVSDNGTEFTCNPMLNWSEGNQIAWHFIVPRKPTQNGFCERRFR